MLVWTNIPRIMNLSTSYQLTFLCIFVLFGSVLCHVRHIRAPEPVSTPSGVNGNEIGGPVTPTPSPTFVWKVGDWGNCDAQEQNKCGRTRLFGCYFTESTKQELPHHYCDQEQMPPTFQPCNVCKEDCVVTSWSDWSECSATCAPATRFRIRSVVRRADHGGQECRELSQVEECRDLKECQVEVAVPTYTWKIGEWTSCRQVRCEQVGNY